MRENAAHRTGSHTFGMVLLGFLLVYFLFPVAFAWPVYAVYGSGPAPPAVEKFCGVFFWPVVQLARHAPPYTHLIEREVEWMSHP